MQCQRVFTSPRGFDHLTFATERGGVYCIELCCPNNISHIYSIEKSDGDVQSITYDMYTGMFTIGTHFGKTCIVQDRHKLLE